MERGKRTSARIRMRTPLRNEYEKLAGYLRRLFRQRLSRKAGTETAGKQVTEDRKMS